MPVNEPSNEYSEWILRWVRCRDCYEGSDAVKDAGIRYLPALDSHDSLSSGSARYQAYKMRALYFNAMARTVDGLSGAIHQRDPEIDNPPKMDDHLEDITLTSVPASIFAFEITKEVLKVGRVGILVDVPAAASSEVRPYWIKYRAEDIVSWRMKRRAGDEVLTRVVLKELETIDDPVDRFAEKEIEQYRVLEIIEGVYTQTLWRKPDDMPGEATKGGAFKPFVQAGQTDATMVPNRRGNTKLDFIPFVFISAASISPPIAKPPLLDLVDVNLSHYRTMADLEHGRHFTALPTPWVAGLSNAGKETKLSIGSGKAWILDVQGRAGMLEFTGQGLGALEAADEQKRKMMATLGARLLEEQPRQPETVGAVGMRHSGEHVTLRSVAGSIERGLTQALRWHAWWVGTEADPSKIEAAFELNKEFFSIQMTTAELKDWVFALQADAVSYATFYQNFQKGGMARLDVDWEAELQEIEDSGGTPNSAGNLPPMPVEERQPVVRRIERDADGRVARIVEE